LVGYIAKSCITVDKGEVLRYLGHKQNNNISPELNGIIDEMSDLGIKLAEPQYVYDVYPLKKEEKTKKVIPLYGNKIDHLLRNCTDIIAMAVTIGPALENEVTRLFEKKEYTRGIVLDAVGTQLSEASADALEDILEEGLYGQYFLTRRYSPGYGDWGLDVQPYFLKALSADDIGITVSEANILLPRKSITAIIGLAVEKQEKEGICPDCSFHICSYRKEG
jgi:hypothetical protein